MMKDGIAEVDAQPDAYYLQRDAADASSSSDEESSDEQGSFVVSFRKYGE